MISILITSLAGIAAIFCLWIEIQKWILNRTKLRAYSKLKQWPILGVGGRFIGQDNEASMRSIDRLFYEKQQPFAAWFGPTICIGIDDPEDMYTILNADQCLDKPYLYSHLRNETGLFSSDKELWKQHRRVLNPTLNSKIVNSFVPTFNRKASILVEQLERHYLNTPFDIYRPIFKALTDTIMNTGLGMNWELQTKRGDDIHDIFIEVMNSFQSRVVRFWYKWDFIYSFSNACKRELALLEKGYRILRSVREVKEIELTEQLERGVDVLERSKEQNMLTWVEKCFLMYRNGMFTEQNLVEEIDTIFVGGTDTTTVTVSSVLIMLAIYPDIQDKVVAELHEIFSDRDTPVTNEHIPKLTYLEMVIKETLRHFPVGPFIARKASVDFPFKGGIIPKDSFILLNIAKMHKDPKYWGEKANDFYPEHFLPENFSRMHPYTFLAFSGGPRNCIGIKYAWFVAKIMLAHLLRHYKFTTDLKYEDIRTKVTIILKIANENPVRVERRNWTL